VHSTWTDLRIEIQRWNDAGRVVEFWWRDDDASEPTTALLRLVALAAQAQVPLALAVIPDAVRPGLFPTLDPRWVRVLQHGCDHVDRAAAGQKKTEFPATEPVEQALVRLQAGWERLQGAAASRVLVPPWNRIGSSALPGRLASAGYRGLSRFGARAREPSLPGLVQVNTHVDLIDWHGTRGFAGADPVLRAALAHLRARREGRADPREPTGWLTHHLVHDEACWDFLQRLFDFCRAQGTVAWRAAADLFDAGSTGDAA